MVVFKCVIVFLVRDIPQIVMYCVNGKPRSSLFIESIDSMIINHRRACAGRVTVVVSCVCVCLSVCLSVCMYVCLSEHAILAVRAIRSITKDAIVLSVRFAAILKRRFS